MIKIIGKYINKNLSGKYSQKLLDHAKKFAIDANKTSSKRVIQKIAQATGDLTGNKITDRNWLIWRHLQMKKKDIYLLKKGKKLLMI